jgi:phage gp36-like protein
MAYADPSHLVQFGLPAATLTGLSTEDQEAALEAASDYIDSYLAQRFTLPLTDWQDDLRRATCHVAGWDILARRGFNPDRPIDGVVRKRYEDTIRWLEKVARGELGPVGVVDSTEAGETAAAVVYTDARRRW